MKQSFNQSKKTYVLQVHTTRSSWTEVIVSKVDFPLEHWEGGEVLPMEVQKLVDVLGINWRDFDSSEWIEITLPDIHQWLEHI